MGLFNQINLQTPESVELEYKLAGIGNRAYALAIDYLIFGIILIFWLIVWAFLSWQVLAILENLLGNTGKTELWLLAINLIIIFLIYVGYFVFFETLWQGQSPGKRYVKIRVIRDDARPVTLQQSTLRALLRPFDDMLFIGAFLIIFSKQEKRLGDWIAGTMVIQEERGNISSNFTLSPEAQSLADELQLANEIEKLLPEDFALIKEYLQRRAGMIPKARVELAEKLAIEIKNIMGLETIPEGVTANIFLEGIYLAYQNHSVNTKFKN